MSTADDILENSQGPKRASGESGSMEQFSIREQIEADRYKKSVTASQVGFGAMRHTKLVPPGAVDVCCDEPFNRLCR